ncbi:uncharacterized protein LOC107271789 [Cephus cinctus]|uniref:Uncharacterized protein LOC107271789 n=1 Tax=Cephus cinctus TaxID=211228 RepID=A0AAJ7FQT0_CEPCN|nr:uncharacterized protein LOC107271789 [Cephus cinctus]
MRPLHPSGCCVIIMSRSILECLIEPLRQYEIWKCRTMWLQKYNCFLVICAFLQSVVHGGGEICKFPFGGSNNAIYHCENLSDLEVVDKIPKNVKTILFEDSNLQHIHGYAFFRLGQTLITLDIHNSQVASIDANAFAGLRNLETLLLYGNDLSYVYADWFTDLPNLRTLDVSFNSIVGFEPNVSKFLPKLENFYFDGNIIESIDTTAFYYDMPKLKKVIMGNNPWIWSFRALLMHNLDLRGINHEDDWEDWKWINAVIWECHDKITSAPINDQLLNCAAMRLLTSVNEHLKFQDLTSSSDTRCHPAASTLIKCSRSISSNKTDEEAVAMSLREIFHGIKSMEYPQDKFRLQ